VQRPITITIVVAMTSLLALVFWQLSMDATAGNAAVANPRLQTGYTMPSNPYLPVRRLQPVW
jgi:hypothetical protein